MTTGETLRMLEESNDYTRDRVTINDDFIDMVRSVMPLSYERIQEKEEQYLQLVKTVTDGLNNLELTLVKTVL